MSSGRKQLSLKRNLFTVHVGSSEWNCVLVRMLTASLSLSLSPSTFPFPPLHFCFSSRPGRPPKRTQSVTSPENPHIMPHTVPGLMSPGMIPPTGNTHRPPPAPRPPSQRPAAHPLNGTLQNLTALIQTTSQNH